jgi:hypothetical protein
MPEVRAMAQGYKPSGITAHRAPSGANRQDKPLIQLEESVSGFRYKQTDSDAHRGITLSGRPRVKVEWPPTAGWTVQSPGTGRRQPVAPRPHVRCRASTAPEARNPADSAGEQQPGYRGNPRPGRWPRSLLLGITAHKTHSGAETVLGQPGWYRGLAGH